MILFNSGRRYSRALKYHYLFPGHCPRARDYPSHHITPHLHQPLVSPACFPVPIWWEWWHCLVASICTLSFWGMLCPFSCLYWSLDIFYAETVQVPDLFFFWLICLQIICIIKMYNTCIQDKSFIRWSFANISPNPLWYCFHLLWSLQLHSLSNA